jgi:hypothetical protein
MNKNELRKSLVCISMKMHNFPWKNVSGDALLRINIWLLSITKLLFALELVNVDILLFRWKNFGKVAHNRNGWNYGIGFYRLEWNNYVHNFIGIYKGF